MLTPSTPTAVRLRPHRRRYAWGSNEAVPRLLHVAPDGEPWAEAWFGTHPAGPAVALTEGGEVPLDVLLARTASREDDHPGHLSFLVKLLAAEQPLSIQVHPDAERARRGFDAEQAAGLAIDAPERNFPDPNPKPETIVALGPFRALVGLAEPTAAAAELAQAGLDPLAHRAAAVGTGNLLLELLRLDPGEQAAFARRAAESHPLAAELARWFPGDVGVVAGLLLHQVDLAAGEAVHLEPGTPHAYVRGVGLEVMAPSDGVLRAGLTTKPIRIDLFAEVCSLRPTTPRRLRPASDGDYPVPEAAPYRIRRLPAGTTAVTARTVVVCLEGRAGVGELTLEPGQVALCLQAADATASNDATVFAVGPAAPPRRR